MIVYFQMFMSVLVTDCLVLLTEKDQKLNIAGLLDSKGAFISQCLYAGEACDSVSREEFSTA